MRKSYDFVAAQERAKVLRREMVGKHYRHYKGDTYLVVDVNVDEEAGEPRISYVSDTHGYRWSRLYNVWCSAAKWGTANVPRFVEVQSAELNPQ